MARFPTRYNHSGIFDLNEISTAAHGKDWPHVYGTDPYRENVICDLRAEIDYDYAYPSYYGLDFVGSSFSPVTWTSTGFIYQGNFTPWSASKGRWGVEFFSGAAPGEYYSFADDSSLQFGTGDFTIDFYIQMNDKTSYQTLMAKGYDGTGHWAVQTSSNDGNIVFFNGTTAVATESGTTVNLGQWYRITITRSGTAVKIYRDGVQVATGTSSTDLNTTSALTIGNSAVTTTYYVKNSTFSNVRLIKGEAVTPTTDNNEPLEITANTVLYTCASRRHEDLSSYEQTISLSTTYIQCLPYSPFPELDPFSIYRNAGSYRFVTGARMSTTSTDIMDFGTDDFMVEFWYYNKGSATTGYNTIISSYDGDNAENALRVYANGGVANQLLVQVNSSGTTLFAISNAWQSYEWNHFAIARDSGTTRLFKNGKEIASTADSNNYVNGGSGVGVGDDMYSTLVYPANGYIADMHIVKGFPIYTEDFDIYDYYGTSRSTYGLDSPGFYNAATRTLLSGFNYGQETSGTFSFIRYGGTQSDTGNNNHENNFYFDGTGDYLFGAAEGHTHYLYDNDFTIDGWFYADALGSATGIFHFTNAYLPSNSSGVAFGLGSASPYNYYVYFNGTQYDTGVAGTATTWKHFALVRQGATLTLYIDGTSIWSTSVGTTSITTSALNLGAYYSSSYTWQGNIEGFRITKGVARYTGNFTVPSAPQPLVGGVA